MSTPLFGLNILSTFLGLLVVCFLAILFFIQLYDSKMPPGPAWIPLVGNLTELASDPDLRVSLRRLQKKYGNIYKLYLGPRPTIVVCGYDAIRELFIKRGIEFSDRPAGFLVSIILNGEKGITAVSGDTWKNHRKFIIITLRNFGFGKSNLEDKIHTEVKLFLSELENLNKTPFQMMAPIQTSVGNVISHLVFGGHFRHDDPRFKTLMDGFNSFLKDMSVGSLVTFLPILRFVPGDFFGIKNIIRKMQVVKDFVNELVEEHMKKFNAGNIVDFIDAFIAEMKKENDGEKKSMFTRGTVFLMSRRSFSQDLFSRFYCRAIELNRELLQLVESYLPYKDQHQLAAPEDYLAAIIMDLFLAGMETTSTTVTWASFYLATRPDIQSRIFEEIKANVGTERLPSMQDKQSLVYTEAYIMEVLRMSIIVIISAPHATVMDVIVRGYHIPKGMQIFPDIHSVLSDPEIWGDPENFRPERFISEDGTLLKPDEFIPFFTGRRNCLGESLARMELFLFIGALVQRFELMPPEGKTLNMKDVDGIFGGTHAPKPFYIRAIPRHDKA